MSMERMRNMLTQILKPLRNRVYTMISRAIIETVNDANGMQVVKASLLAGETRTDVERFQNFGFSSNPPADSECIALAIGGDREHLVIIAAESRNVRVKDLANGESVVYTDDGTIIHLKKGGEIEILAANKIDVKVPEINLGTALLEKVFNAETFQTLFNTHTHTGNLGVATGPPNALSGALELSTQVKASK